MKRITLPAVRTCTAATVTTVLAIAATVGAVPANASAAHSDDALPRLELYSPQTGESERIEPRGGVGTRSIGPYGNTYCNTAAASFVLTNYSNVAGEHYNSGSTAFTCGNANGGFIHVRDRHAAEWLTRYAAYGPTAGLDWSDVADFDIRTTLKAPLSTRDAGDQKTCFGGLIQIREVPSGNILFKYEPSVYVSQNNRRIITAIPSTRERCSGIFG